MGILIRLRRAVRRGALWVPALLLIAAAGALAPLPAQAKLPFSLAEVRQIQKIRETRQTDEAEALASAALTYVKKFPDGRYADEALLALGEARARLGVLKKALAAYGKLIASYPDSPFREQAMAASIPLLEKTGDGERAGALSAELLERYPRSLYKARTLLWQARGKYESQAYAEAAALLEQVEPAGLGPQDFAPYYRLAGWSYWKLEQPGKAWPMFARYLKREDSAEHKAPVLMLMGERLEKSGEPAEALAYYDQLAGRYPAPGFLNEALFRRARLFARIKLAGADEEQAPALRAEAIERYGAYLNSSDEAHLEPALIARARLLKESGRKAEALSDYERLGALKETQLPDLAILRLRVEMMGELGRHREGIALLTRAIDNTAVPQQIRTAMVVERAGLYYGMESCEGVIASLRPLPVFSVARDRKRAFFLRGFCQYRLGNWEKASWDLEGLFNDADYVKLVWPPLLESYERSGQHSRLVNLGERLLSSGQAKPSAELLSRMARAYEKLGEPNMMLSTIKRLEELDPGAVQGAEIQYRLGRAEQAMGREDKAQAHYLAVVQREQENGEPPRAYLEALERLQGLYLNKGRFEELTELNEQAAERVKARDSASRRVATWRALAYLGWGKAMAGAGDQEAAGAKIQQAWKIVPPAAGKARMEILEALLQHYAHSNAYEKARKLYGRERKLASSKALQTRLDAAFAGFYLNWAKAGEKKEAPAKVIARYKKAISLLPPERWQERYRAAASLDGLYRKTGNFKARVELYATISEAVPDAGLRDQLRLYRSRIYGDWSRSEAKQKRYPVALRLTLAGEKLLEPEEWKPRYELLAARGEVLLKQKNYSELLIQYEKFLPAIEDEELRGQVSHFVGQIYLTWAKAARRANNNKSTRIRAHRALDFLPPEDWERRLAAAELLGKALENEQKLEQAVEIHAALIPQLPEGEARRRYALFLGRKYLAGLKDAERAGVWLQQGDAGGNDPLSLEAGYLMADVEVRLNKSDAAIARLQELTGRGLTESKWLVPIYSRLAVLYHEKKQLRLALRNYKVVARVKSPTSRKLYPKSIGLAKAQVRAIRHYLKFRGGDSGKKVAVPKVKR